MKRSGAIAVAVFCGGVAAILYLAVLLGSPGSLILVYLTQLPLFVAGLWLGLGAAATAAGTASLVLLGVGDLLAAGLFAALNAMPVLVLVRQALLARQTSDGTTEWYPPGKLIAWLTVLALVGIVAAMVAFGGPDVLAADLQTVISTAIAQLGEPASSERDTIAGMLAAIVPGLVGGSWMTMVIVNGSLAQALIARFHANWRPSPALDALVLPMWMPLLLAAAAAATSLGETARFFGVNAMLVLLVPFCLGGFAVVHAGATRLSHPMMALVGVYVVAGLFGWPLLIIAVLGLIEPWLGLRRRLARPRSVGGRNNG